MEQGHASMTARRVAAQRLHFDRLPAAFGRPEADQRLQTDIAAGLDAVVSPMTRYLQLRTSFFDHQVIDWIGNGRSQIVVVGAGYDGRSLRYERDTVRWFELDHPDTQADKRARLDRLGLHSPCVAFAAADFGARATAEALRGAGHEPAAASLFLCEGVAVYLPEDVLSDLLSSLAGCAAAGSKLAIEIALAPETHEDAQRRSRLREAVARMGEPFTFTLPRQALPGFLAAAGWIVERATDPAGVGIAASTRSAAFVVAGPA